MALLGVLYRHRYIALAVLGISVVIGINEGYNYYASQTFLKPLYAQIKLATAHSRELDFPGYITSTTDTYGSNGSKKTGPRYCRGSSKVRSGSILPGKFMLDCYVNYAKYYYLVRLDPAVIEIMDQRMHDLGWQTDPYTTDKDQMEKDLFRSKASDVGLGYRREDGTMAQLRFIRRINPGTEDQQYAIDRDRGAHDFYAEVDIMAHQSVQ